MSAFPTFLIAIIAIAAAFPQGARALPGRVTRVEAGAQFAKVDHLLDVIDRSERSGPGVGLPVGLGSTVGVLGGLSAGASRHGELFAAGVSLDLRAGDMGFSGRFAALGGLSLRVGRFELEVMGEGGGHLLPVLANPLTFYGGPVNFHREGSTTVFRPFVGGRISFDWIRGRDDRKFVGFWLGVLQDLGTWHAAFDDREGPLGSSTSAYTVDSATFEALVGFRIGFNFADE